MRPVTEIAKGEHGDDVSAGVCSPTRMKSKRARANQKSCQKKKERKVRNDISGKERKDNMGEGWWKRKGREERTFEEVSLLDAELAYAGAEPEEGKAEDGAE